MKEIVILCPGNIISGGVNSLLNLCKSLNDNGFKAKIHFYDIDEKIINSDIVKSYKTEQFDGQLDSENNIIVVPETQTERISQFTKATKLVYWLGLLYYYKSPAWRFPFNFKILRKLIACPSYAGFSNGYIELIKRRLNEFAKSKINIWTDDYIHLSNSYLVTDFCKNRGAKHAYSLLNPIHDEFYEKKTEKTRKKIILFGQRSPKSIIWITRWLFRDHKVVKLRKMSHQQVVEYMSKAEIFVELGINHGRDRMPREASMLGCVVFMNKRGSSSNFQDYNLDKYYLLRNNILNYVNILKKIKAVVQNRDQHFDKQKPFRQQLVEERQNFDNNVKKTFTEIINL